MFKKKKKKCEFCEAKDDIIYDFNNSVEVLSEKLEKASYKSVQSDKLSETHKKRIEFLTNRNKLLKEYILKNTPIIKGLDDIHFQNEILLKMLDINTDDNITDVEISISSESNQIPNVTMKKEML